MEMSRIRSSSGSAGPSGSSSKSPKPSNPSPLSSPPSSPSKSPPKSPPRSPAKLISASVGNVANIFVRMRRFQERAKDLYLLEESSGEPQSHRANSEYERDPEGDLFIVENTFICINTVNMVFLLKLTRDAVLDLARTMVDKNALADEQWKYTVSKPRPDGSWRIYIEYRALPVRCSAADCHKPVALDKIKNLQKGCMTIVERDTNHNVNKKR